jgi:membrane protease YdiL (CAAX protease family)
MMDPSRYFLLPDGRPRAGWRLLLFVFVFLVAINLASWVGASFGPTSFIPAQVLLLTLATIPTTWLMTHLVEHQPFHSIGMALSPPPWRQAGAGLGIGAALAGSVIVIEWSAGLVSFHSHPGDVTTLVAGAFQMSGVLLLGAASEEILFRGYPFQRLVEGTGSWAAVGISSLLFGLGHARNPNATELSVVNTTLAGTLLGLAYLRGRSLWLPIGLHFSWNWALALCGLPVSGAELIRMPWQTVAASRFPMLHGANYGPEGGLITTVALSVGIIYLGRSQDRPSDLAQGSKTAEPAPPPSEEHEPPGFKR